MQSWGWRLPFLLAAPMGLIGRYIRTKLEDTPVFRELAAEDQTVKAPVSSLFRNHWRQLLQAVGAVLLNAVGFYVILSYMPTYLSSELGLGETESFLATTIALPTYIGFIFLTGMLSDRLRPQEGAHHRLHDLHRADGARLRAAGHRELPGDRPGPDPAGRACSRSTTARSRASWRKCSPPVSATAASRSASTSPTRSSAARPRSWQRC